jgi:hypothetical protein
LKSKILYLYSIIFFFSLSCSCYKTQNSKSQPTLPGPKKNQNITPNSDTNQTKQDRKLKDVKEVPKGKEGRAVTNAGSGYSINESNE